MEKDKNPFANNNHIKKTKKELMLEIVEKNEKLQLLEQENKEVQNKLKRLQRTNDELNTKLNKCEKEISTLTEQNNSLQLQVKEWEQKYAAILQQKDQAVKEKIAELKRENGTLQNKLKELQKKLDLTMENLPEMDQSKKAIFRLEFWLEGDSLRGRISKMLSPHKLNLNGLEEDKIADFIANYLPGNKAKVTEFEEAIKEGNTIEYKTTGNGVKIKEVKIIQNKRSIEPKTGLQAGQPFQIQVLLEFERSLTLNFNRFERFFDIRTLAEEEKSKSVFAGSSNVIEIHKNQTSYMTTINMPALKQGVYQISTYAFVPFLHLKMQHKIPGIEIK